MYHELDNLSLGYNFVRKYQCIPLQVGGKKLLISDPFLSFSKFPGRSNYRFYIIEWDSNPDPIYPVTNLSLMLINK